MVFRWCCHSDPSADVLDVYAAISEKPLVSGNKNNEHWGHSIVAVAEKKDHGPDPTLGLSLIRDNHTGRFTVDQINPSSPFARTETSLLRAGMIITSVNGLMITGMDMDAVFATIHDAPHVVVLTAQVPIEMEPPARFRQRVVASIDKTRPNQPLGLFLLGIPNATSTPTSTKTGGRHPRHHHHRIRKSTTAVIGRMAPESPFRGTKLRVGMTIVSVNGMDVASSGTRSILRYLQEECPSTVTILAEMDIPVNERIHHTDGNNVTDRTSSSSSCDTRQKVVTEQQYNNRHTKRDYHHHHQSAIKFDLPADCYGGNERGSRNSKKAEMIAYSSFQESPTMQYSHCHPHDGDFSERTYATLASSSENSSSLPHR